MESTKAYHTHTFSHLPLTFLHTDVLALPQERPDRVRIRIVVNLAVAFTRLSRSAVTLSPLAPLALPRVVAFLEPFLASTLLSCARLSRRCLLVGLPPVRLQGEDQTGVGQAAVWGRGGRRGVRLGLS
jgi:hypothetical protein